MTTLADEIEAMRLKMLEAAEEEQFLVDTLAQRMAEADAKVLASLRQIAVDQEHRRRNIAHLLATLAARVGHLPSPTAPPPLPHTTNGQRIAGVH